jgi:thioredoxin-like negative regulator of GroEL
MDKHVANPEADLATSQSMEQNADLTRQARGHYKIAEGEMLLNNPEAAKEHLVTVLRLARGTALAQKADQMLLTLPEHLIAPPIGSTRHANAELVSLNAAKANDKPSILVFCAPWIESCKTVLSTLHAALGPDQDKVNIVWIDADKEETQSILDEYGVKPLPAVLYLNHNNQVLLYTLGDAGETVMRSRVRLLLDADDKLKKEDREKSNSSP